VTGLENGSDLDSKRLPALVALIDANAGALALHLANPLNPAAMWAHRAFRPNAGFYPSISGCFILKSLGI
jgi:hypothetical protein